MNGPTRIFWANLTVFSLQRLSRRYENYDESRGASEDAMARDWAREEAKAGSVTQLVESLRERFPNLQVRKAPRCL